MATLDVKDLSVAQASAALERRETSAVELVEALARRIEQVEPAVLAWETLDLEGARKQARQRDEERAAGNLRGPLHGIPVGIKDIYYTADLPTRAGTVIHKDFRPSLDATAVSRLRRAGAIILGKTTTTEFGFADPAPTRNPWNPEHTPGGSSSGSAASVAAGMCLAAVGSQTGGSVLRPASYCGVVGLKPTYGRIGRRGVFPVAWSMDHPGTFTRTVADAAVVLSVVAGAEPGDPTAASVPVPDYVTALDGAPAPRIGLMRRPFQDLTEPETWDRVEAAASRLASAGAGLLEIETAAEFRSVYDVYNVITAVEAATYHSTTFAQRPDDYRPLLRSFVEIGQMVPTSVYLQAQRARNQLARQALDLFDRCDVLLMSSTTGPAPRGLESTGDPACNAPWSALGFPALTLPIGLSSDGLPLGMQLVAPPWREERLLAAAHWCERALEVDQSPPL